MPRASSAAALAAVVIVLWPTYPQAEAPTPPDLAPEWRHAETMPGLTATLDDWLDVNSAWSRRDAPPRIRIVSEWEAKARRGVTASRQNGPLRGLYDADREEIMLVAPWNPRSAKDVSVLLHELIHHRQAPYHWYCPAAQELPACRLQDAWLAERGMRANMNWMAVVLESGCARRDIHPD